MCAIYSCRNLRISSINRVPCLRNSGSNVAGFLLGPIVGTTKVNFLEILCGAFFCRKTICGRHTTSLVEVLAWQANPLLDFHRAVPAPSHSVGDRAGRRRSLIQMVSREMGVADCTAGFRPAQKRRKDGRAHSQPYAPAGWRGGSGKVGVLPEFSSPSSELNYKTMSEFDGVGTGEAH